MASKNGHRHRLKESCRSLKEKPGTFDFKEDKDGILAVFECDELIWEMIL